MPVFKSLLKQVTYLALATCGCALAADISLVGVFPGKAVLTIDNSPPKTFSVGATVTEGIKLVAADQTSATLEMNGKRQTIGLGQHHSPVGSSASSGAAKVVLQADSRGHFYANGQINGVTVRMMVDTGATLIALPATDAKRMGIDYRSGTIGYTRTANGVAQVYRVKLNNVKVGDIELNQVDASVSEGGLSFALLGMSFLNRTAMQRDGDTMTLTKRY